MPDDANEPARPRRFGPDRILMFPVLVFFLGSLPLAVSVPWLGWLVLVPVAVGVWVLRARVVADSRGLTVCNGLGRRRWPWEEVSGFDVPRRGPVRLLTGGHRVPLTALSRSELPEVMAVARPA